MNKDFPRIITMLRKEKNLSQKQVSTDLGISQALLSLYENGIRECGLDFLVRVAEYYNVSCDFLLGRTPERSGATLSFEDIPDAADDIDSEFKGSGLATQLNKRVLCNSIAIIYDMLLRAKSTQITADVSNYMMLSVYKIFRTLYSANPDNHQSMFSVNPGLFSGYCDSYMGFYSTKLSFETSMADTSPSSKKIKEMKLSSDMLSKEYPKQSSSLFNLIQHAESKIKKRS